MSIGREMCVQIETQALYAKHLHSIYNTKSTYIGLGITKCVLVSKITCLFFILPYAYHETFLISVFTCVNRNALWQELCSLC